MKNRKRKGKIKVTFFFFLFAGAMKIPNFFRGKIVSSLKCNTRLRK